VASLASACDPQQLPRECILEEEGGGRPWSSLLAKVCEKCTLDEGCEQDADLRGVAVLTFQSTPAPEYDPCLLGSLAAVLITSQYHFLELTDEMIQAFDPPRTLDPFPLNTASYSLHTNMLPVSIGVICSEAVPTRNKFVPRAEHANARCGSRRSDSQLTRICRSKRRWKKSLPDHSAQLAELAARCPAKRLEPEDVESKLGKYFERAGAGQQCQSRQGMWRLPMSDEHKCVLVSVAEMLGFQAGNLVLDWGSGCGHKMSWAKMFFDVDAFGVDIVEDAVNWAKRHSLGTFCATDGRDLRWIPPGIFDHVFSFAAIYHLEMTEQCEVGWQLASKLKVGGRGYLGWNRLDSMVPGEWDLCFSEKPPPYVDPGVRVQVEFVEDAFLFPEREMDANRTYLYQFPAYSMFMKRVE
jgi:hypothetical protein